MSDKPDIPTLDISVIVVNFNGEAMLDACFEGLRRQADVSVEAILVDNGSSDGSVARVRQRFPEVRLIELPVNRGFAGGNNAGAAGARGRRRAFLNNDAVPEPSWLRHLSDSLDANPWAAMATSRIVYQDDPSILDSAGDGLTRWGGAFKRHHGQSIDLATEGGEVFGACGAAFMIEKEVFDLVGGFDEDFFLSHEDVDLSYRIQLRGRGCVYAPDATVTHAVSTTLGRISAKAVFYGQRNLEWMYLKNTPWPLLLRTLPGHVAYGMASGLYHASIGQVGPFARGKMAAVAGLPMMLAKRRVVQRTRTSTSGRIWSLMERGWLGIKWREKRFDIGARQRT